MTQAIILAFLCLMATALNDFVFKLYSEKASSRGWFICIVGVIWFFVLLPFPHDAEASALQTLLWGCVSGFFSLTANILLIESMRWESAGVCSTLYRLNLVLVPIGAYFLLDERLTMKQAGGVLFAIIAVVMFFPFWRKNREGHSGGRGYLLVIIAAALRACQGLSYRLGYLHHADKNLVVVINSLFWVVGGMLYALFAEKTALNLKDKRQLAYGGFSGALVAAIVYFMASMLNVKEGNASVCLAIAQMSFLVTLGMSVVFLHERLTFEKLTAVAAGAVAILLLTV